MRNSEWRGRTDELGRPCYTCANIAMSRIFRVSLLLSFFFGLEKFLGFLRQLVIARQFGLSPELDAFNAANNLPDFIFTIISGGALAVAFIPVLSEYLEKKGRPAAWELFSQVANLFFLFTAILSIAIALSAEEIVRSRIGIVPGFDAEQQILVVDLMRLNLIATLMFSISGLVMAGLQANQHFLLPAIAPSMYDLGMFFGVLILAPSNGYRLGGFTLPAFGLGVYGLAYGVIIGAILFLGIQIPGLIRYRFRWTPVIRLSHPGVRHVLALLRPRVVTIFFIQLVLQWVPDNIASHLPVGSVTALVFGWLIMQLPETLIGTAIGTALLPTLSEYVVRQEKNIYYRSLNHALRGILALTLPCTVLLLIGIRPLISVFGFDAAGTDLVVWTARAFLVGLAGHSLLEIAARAFYAQQDARTPLLASMLMAITFIISAFLLSRLFGAAGIGLANSFAFTGEALFLLFLLNRRFPGLLRVGRTLIRALLASAGGGTMVYALMRLDLPVLPLTMGALIAGGLVALPFIWPEVKLLMKMGS